MACELALTKVKKKFPRSFIGFFLRLTLVHVLTCFVVGALSYFLIVKQFWTGPGQLPGLRDPQGEFVQRWILPAQILRAFLYAVALFPLRKALLDLGKWGSLVIACAISE